MYVIHVEIDRNIYTVGNLILLKFSIVLRTSKFTYIQKSRTVDYVIGENVITDLYSISYLSVICDLRYDIVHQFH